MTDPQTESRPDPRTPRKVEPTECDCLPCRLVAMNVPWEHALPVIAAAANVDASRIDAATARQMALR